MLASQAVTMSAAAAGRPPAGSWHSLRLTAAAAQTEPLRVGLGDSALPRPPGPGHESLPARVTVTAGHSDLYVQVTVTVTVAAAAARPVGRIGLRRRRDEFCLSQTKRQKMKNQVLAGASALTVLSCCVLAIVQVCNEILSSFELHSVSYAKTVIPFYIKNGRSLSKTLGRSLLAGLPLKLFRHWIHPRSALSIELISRDLTRGFVVINHPDDCRLVVMFIL